MDREEFLRRYCPHFHQSQIRAVEAVDGPVLLLAVPGSGKTSVLVARLGYMLLCRGIDPKRILCLTYTVAATRDMRKRFEQMFGESLGRDLDFRTINGLCARILARYAKEKGKALFALLGEEKEQGRLLGRLWQEAMGEYPLESDVNRLKMLISYCKNSMLQEPQIRRLGEREKLPLWDLFQAYNTSLRQQGLMDYDDQMRYAYNLLQGDGELLLRLQRQYAYLCVDEAQDSSMIQHQMITLLSGQRGNLFMVGDEDQSIYGFRGAYPQALLDFSRRFAGAQILTMNRNYRSNAHIVRRAEAFIRHNKARYAKNMEPALGEGPPICFVRLGHRYNQYGYLLKVARDCDQDTAVLFRDNEHALPLVDLLERGGISYRIRGRDIGFFSHRVVRDIENILLFSLRPWDGELFQRWYYTCQSFLTREKALRLCRLAEEKGLPVLEALGHMRDLGRFASMRCRTLAAHLAKMAAEPPEKALYRIEQPMGYGEYMQKNGLDKDKLYLLRQIARQEGTVEGFLERLEYLQNCFAQSKEGEGVKFQLSTIHSSKGLEFDRVLLLDVCDGIFPKTAISKGVELGRPDQEVEEERRLFYVAITRAKRHLTIFGIENAKSCFVQELCSGERVEPRTGESAGGGKGGLSEQRGEYESWAERYPDHVVICREGESWVCRGESALTLHKLLGYSLRKTRWGQVAGASSLERLLQSLEYQDLPYVVIEDGVVIEQRDAGD